MSAEGHRRAFSTEVWLLFMFVRRPCVTGVSFQAVALSHLAVSLFLLPSSVGSEEGTAVSAVQQQVRRRKKKNTDVIEYFLPYFDQQWTAEEA